MEMTLKNVYKVYSGKIGCMCGCRGKYSTASAFADFASKERGYDADDVNDRSIKIIAGKLLRNDKAVRENNYLFFEDNGRMLCAYFK